MLKVNTANAPFVIAQYPTDELIASLRKMYLIRKFEEGAEQCYTRGLIHGTMHLSIGQEASAVASCLPLRADDQITSTHRGHGHCLAKDADVARMFAEFFGKETGYCKGRGGSMHIADFGKGNLGANGIVGGGIPIAVGAALTAKRLNTGKVVVCFFGDGANNEGAFHESLNMASVWKLPVVFVCENNQYGMSTSTKESTAVEHIADRASAYSMPGKTIDGNEFSDVAETMHEAVNRARDGDGPSLVENITYRWRGHSKSDRNRYRSKQEIEQWKAQDPIARFARLLCDHDILNSHDISAMEADVDREIADAIEFAQSSPAPRPEQMTRDVYTESVA